MHDVIIIGGGPGGYVAAIRARQLGLNVLLIEQDKLGGTCLNRGCIPTKAYYHNAKFLRNLDQSAYHGVQIADWHFNLAQAWENKEEVVQTLLSGIERLLKANAVQLLGGRARLLDKHTVIVDGKKQQGHYIILATGSVPAQLPLVGLDLPGILNSDEILDLKELPDSLAVIGGGVIGLEFACIFQAFGSQVTVIEEQPRLLGDLDEELGRRLGVSLRRQGINVLTQSRLKSVQTCQDLLHINLENKKGPMKIMADKVLLATGRLPNTAGLGLDELGIATGPKGFIKVDQNYQTNLDNIYAIGDVIGGQMLAHVASEEGVAVIEALAGLGNRSASPVVPSCIFTLPEMATVGLSEQEAKNQQIEYRLGRFQWAANGKALTMRETDGIVKVLVDEKDLIIGLHIMGPHASDLILEGLLLIEGKLSCKQAINMIHPHPTLGEALREALLDANKEAIHLGPAKR